MKSGSRLLLPNSPKAEQQANAEIASFHPLNESEILARLQQYRDDPDGEAAFEERTKQYRKAKNILRDFCSRRVQNENDFRTLYDQLVIGTENEGRLWFSSGLQRNKGRVVRSWHNAAKLFQAICTNISRSPEQLFGIALSLKHGVKGLGINVITEALNTMAPAKFAVLNKRPLSALEYFGYPKFPNPQSFSPAQYADFNEVELFVQGLCGFYTIAQVDHFLDFVYSREVKGHKQ
jgi:hypothetical protein